MTVRDGCVPAGTCAALCVLPAGPALHPSGLRELGREGGKRSFIPRADRAAPSSHSQEPGIPGQLCPKRLRVRSPLPTSCPQFCSLALFFFFFFSIHLVTIEM